jgi:hypothetical protein
MTAYVIEVGGRPAINPGALRRWRAAVDRHMVDVIRCVAVVVLLLLGLCGMAAAADLAGGYAQPLAGPAPGFGI